MSPTKLPTPARRAWFRLRKPNLRNPLTATAAISFSLTFVVAVIALLLGALPSAAVLGSIPVDTGVVLLIVPLCALLLAILAEAVRTTMRGGLSAPKPRQPNPLDAWKPGQGEG